jgi:hypothetical protein
MITRVLLLLQVQKVPAAAALLVSAAQRHQGLSLRPLATWQPGAAELGLQLLSGEAGDQQDVRTYAIKCLFNEPPERVRCRPGEGHLVSRLHMTVRCICMFLGSDQALGETLCGCNCHVCA